MMAIDEGYGGEPRVSIDALRRSARGAYFKRGAARSKSANQQTSAADQQILGFTSPASHPASQRASESPISLRVGSSHAIPVRRDVVHPMRRDSLGIDADRIVGRKRGWIEEALPADFRMSKRPIDRKNSNPRHGAAIILV